MRHFLPNVDLSKYPKLFVGNRERHATATAVCFIDDNTIVLASLLEKKLYVIRLHDDRYEILDTLVVDGYIDLMDYKDGLLITANQAAYENPFSSLMMINVSNYKLKFIKKLELKGYTPHSIKIIDDKNFIFMNNRNSDFGVFFYNLLTGVGKKFSNFDYFPKDAYIDNNKLLINTSESKPSNGKPVEIKKSKLYLFELNNLKLIDEIEYFGQTDAITLNGENGFIALQSQDEILHFTLTNNKLAAVKNIGGFDFPHGLASRNDKLIVTNYGNNSFDVLSLSNLID